jgi:hypothetical protein
MSIPHAALNTGAKIPLLGLGTWYVCWCLELIKGFRKKGKFDMLLKLLCKRDIRISIVPTFTEMKMKLDKELKIGEVIERKSGSLVRLHSIFEMELTL